MHLTVLNLFINPLQNQRVNNKLGKMLATSVKGGLTSNWPLKD